MGTDIFLLQRAFDDIVDRLGSVQRGFGRALLIGCPDPDWPGRVQPFAQAVDIREPGEAFARAAAGHVLQEDRWEPPAQSYDLAIAVGTLDTVNDLPLALQLIRHALRPGALLIGAVSGGETLPQLRSAMRAADTAAGAAAPHIHPRIEASALAPLLGDAGFIMPVVDVDRVAVSYASLGKLVADLRGMAATNVLEARPRRLTRGPYSEAARAFAEAGDGGRTAERFEILHFAAWTADHG